MSKYQEKSFHKNKKKKCKKRLFLESICQTHSAQKKMKVCYVSLTFSRRSPINSCCCCRCFKLFCVSVNRKFKSNYFLKIHSTCTYMYQMPLNKKGGVLVTFPLMQIASLVLSRSRDTVLCLAKK